ncbi:hypothetical protein TNCV_2519551 [Trichonephila clavipes]|nr:hypothetical protein TNCV_2519551 [Trichonephila clavipes]
MYGSGRDTSKFTVATAHLVTLNLTFKTILCDFNAHSKRWNYSEIPLRPDTSKLEIKRFLSFRLTASRVARDKPWVHYKKSHGIPSSPRAAAVVDF